jgi:hypothetical protein
MKEIQVHRNDIELIDIDGSASIAQLFVSVPIKYIPALTKIYVGKLETGLTTDNCLCLWIIHPDDVEKPPEEQRKRRSNQHPLCPPHTREGLISGFLEFVFKNPNVCLACPWDCPSCTKDEADCECYEHMNDHPDDYKCEGQVLGVCDGIEHTEDCPSYVKPACLHLDTRKGAVCEACGDVATRRDGQ